jgi:hypothetical protein
MGWTDLRLVVGIVVIASFGTDCVAERGGPEPVTAPYAEKITLTAAAPVFVRTLRFTATSGDDHENSVDGYLEVVGEGGGGPGGNSHPDVSLTVVNPETGVSPEGAKGIGHASVDGWGHSAPCDGGSIFVDDQERGRLSTPCEGSWTVIARWLDPAADSDIKLELNARMTGSVDSMSRSSAPPTFAKFTITAAEEPAVQGQPAVSRGVVRGTVKVDALGQPEAHDLRLHVPAALLDKATFPRLGRLFVGSTATAWTGPPAQASVVATIGDQGTGGYGNTGGEMDWLALCPLRRDCDLPIHLTITPHPMGQNYDATPPPGGSITLDWIVDARLEDFGGLSAFPADLTLVEVP